MYSSKFKLRDIMHSLADVCFHEQQDVDQESWSCSSKHNPDMCHIRRDDPASFSWVWRWQTLRHLKLFCVCLRYQIVQSHHRDDCNRYSKITQCSTSLYMHSFMVCLSIHKSLFYLTPSSCHLLSAHLCY